MTLKERLHRLVDELPADEEQAAERFLRYLRDLHADPVLRALADAAADDEPLTDADREAFQAGLADVQAGRVASTEIVRRSMPSKS